MIKADISIRSVPASDQKIWDKHTRHPLQSWTWGEFRKSMGIDVVRLGVYKNNVLTEGWQVTFHTIPHTPWAIGYFPKGPLPTQKMLEELKKIGRQKNAIFIQLEPNVNRNSSFTIHHLSLLKPSHHPLFTKYTFVLDLTKSEDELLSSMSQKTRYNIRVAQKHGVTIQEDNSPEAFNDYLKLNEETTNRQGFYAHNISYHQHMWDMLSKEHIAHLFTAKYQGQTLAAWILFTWGDTLYYPYGASSRLHREVMAPNLLLWEIVKWAKKRNLSSFDLWGALGPTPNPDDPWYGFHRFKEGYRPQLVEYAGSYDLIIRPVWYRVYTLADFLRWTILKRLQ